MAPVLYVIPKYCLEKKILSMLHQTIVKTVLLGDFAQALSEDFRKLPGLRLISKKYKISCQSTDT